MLKLALSMPVSTCLLTIVCGKTATHNRYTQWNIWVVYGHVTSLQALACYFFDEESFLQQII